MSQTVRHSFHTDADPSGLGSTERSLSTEAPAESTLRPMPIVVASGDLEGAFDLFQPEGSARHAAAPLPLVSLAPAASVAEFSQGQFSRQVARALAAQPAPAEAVPATAGPTSAEIASARALTIAWLTACLIAFFAFLSQGPTISSRTSDDAALPKTVSTEAGPAVAKPGDIKLEAPAEKPASKPRAAKPAAKPVSPPPATPTPQPQP